ncbi:hypothetical protein AALB16_15935 [Lachnospiraceae bacterium 62-35]
MEEMKEQFGLEAESYENIWIPDGTEPSFALFYEFYDSFLNRLLKESQTAFPDLSMEVRLDVDPVPGMDGTPRGCAHEATYNCQDSPYTCAMYSVAMGQEMHREISAGEAEKTMKHILAGMKAVNGGKEIYIDQFLYTDNTPGFEHNARLKEEEMAAFLENIGSVLKSHTIGYGVWAYRNYGNSALYNAQFALGEAGWKFDKGCEVVERNGSKKAKLAPKNNITQEFGRRLGEGETVKVCFAAEAESMAQIQVTMGRETKYVTIQGEDKVYLEFLTRGESITFSTDREAFLDDVKVYTFETDGKLYGIEGEEKEMACAIRSLNAGL